MADSLFSGVEIPSAATSAAKIDSLFAGVELPAKPQGMVENALAPITSLPANYNAARNEGLSTMASGVQDVAAGLTAPNPESSALEQAISGIQQGKNIDEAVASIPAPPLAGNSASQFAERMKAILQMVKGIGKTGLGAAEFVASPINAGLRSVVGQPIENNTGIPKEYSEFAAGLALPIPKRIPTFARAETRAAPTVAELKAAADASYKAPEVASLEINANAVRDFGQKLRADLENKYKVNDTLAPKTFANLERLDKVPDGAFVTADNLDTLRQVLGGVASDAGMAGKERRAASLAIKEIDNFLGTLPQDAVLAGDAAKASETLKDARGNWSAAESAETINRKEFRAEIRAAAANSGKNISNTMRQRIGDILLSKSERQGFAPDELAMMERIVRGGKFENAVRYGGNFLGGGGGLGAMLTTAEGVRGLGAIGAFAQVPGAALKSLSNVMTARNIDKLNEMVRADSPLARKLGQPIEAWSKAIEESHATPDGLARLIISARNLAAGLEEAGIKVAPNSLIRGPSAVGAGAEENQQ